MSKAQQEKIIKNFADEPLLADLNFTELTKEFYKLHVKQKDSEVEAAAYKKKKESIGIDLATAVGAVGADTVTYSHGKKEYRATVIPDDDDVTKTSEDNLRENLMKIGKLDAAVIERIFKASQVPAPRKGYVRVTLIEIGK